MLCWQGPPSAVSPPASALLRDRAGKDPEPDESPGRHDEVSPESKGSEKAKSERMIEKLQESDKEKNIYFEREINPRMG